MTKQKDAVEIARLVGGERLARQIEFALELDRLKNIFRQTSLMDGSGRKENSAEHSWHFSTLALVLIEHASEPVDLFRLVKMSLIHDIVEIDAGDTFVYDTAGELTKREREEKAADRVFGLLPDDQRAEFREVWEEFEAQETPTALFAGALDRLCAVLPNYVNDGGSWIAHNISKQRIIARNQGIADGSTRLWQLAEALIDDRMNGLVVLD